MLRWIPFAMVRITLFFTVGVLLAIYFPGLIEPTYAISLSAVLVGGYFLTLFSVRAKASFISGFIGLLSVLCFGYCHLQISADSAKSDHLLAVTDPITSCQAIVRSSPESKSKSWKVEVEVKAVKTSHWRPVNGKLLLYVSKNAGKITWHYGDRLLIRGSPQVLKPPANPGEFDFKRFLSFRNIYHQQFVLPEQVKWVAAPERKGFIHYSHRVREWATGKMNTYISGDREQAIAGALVLGVTDGIDTDLQNAYAASGAMHVLAVSGLHVGIIYAILLLLLKPLNRYAWSRWLIAIISIVCLWVFAFVTGLSPSVLRAVVMFSFVALARPFGKRTNIYNTLAASAFVLLLYNPYLIMSVGFQLSYLAVLGIVYLQRPIYQLWEIENRVGDWVWEITCVSIAAQIATFALGLLYFHQFPLYFLLSNLFVIPLSTAVLVGGVILLSISFITPLALLLGKLLTWLVQFLNWTVLTTEQLPFSLISDIYITSSQCWLLMGVIVSFLFLFDSRSIRWFYIAFLFIVFFVVLQWNHFQESVLKREFVVYSIAGHHAIEFVDRGKAYFFADSLLDEERVRFHIKPNRLQQRVAMVKSLSALAAAKYLNGILVVEWSGKSIAILSNQKSRLPALLKVDYLVVSNNAFFVDPQVDKEVEIGQIILDGSNSRSYTNRISKFSKAKNIPLYNVQLQNAFILKN